MCRPPDILPGAASFAAGDAFEPVDDFDAGYEASEFDAASDLHVSAILGKREPGDVSRLADAASFGRSAKLPRPSAHVSSAFDSAAATFIARMEQSMRKDLPRVAELQQQKALLQQRGAAAAPAANALLFQQALLQKQQHHQQQQQQQQQLQQLQQLQLLQQLQQGQLKGKLGQGLQEQQLMLLQKQLLQQQQREKLLETLSGASSELADLSSALSVANPLLGAVPAGAAAPAWGIPRQSAGAKLQAWMNGDAQAALPKPGLARAAAVNPAAFAAGSIAPFMRAGSSIPFLPIGDDKKAKRMQSNRASAKRSRQRRQARLEELDKGTATLQAEKSAVASKLSEAQREIQSLEKKNLGLLAEVGRLRKMLGMEEVPSFVQSKEECAGNASCVLSDDMTRGQSAASGAELKEDLESALALRGYSKEVEEELDDDEEDDEEGEHEGWLKQEPVCLSPQGFRDGLDDSLCSLLGVDRAGSPGLEQMGSMLLQGDDFTELLACLEA